MARHLRRLALGAAVAVATLLVGASAGLADASFTDPSGDSGAAPDIVTVSVANTLQGQLTFTVTTNVPTLTTDQIVAVWLDTDKNTSTGGSNGEDYVLWVSGTQWFFRKVSGQNFDANIPQSTVSASHANRLTTLSVNRSELGNTSSLHFYAASGQYTQGNLVASDFAPDRGLYSYDIAARDTIAPTAPGPLAGEAVNATSVRLTWGASTDNVGVVAYNIRRNGSPVADVAGTRYVDTGLRPGTRYRYAVTAIDAEGNSSPASQVSVTTRKIAKSIVFGAHNTLPSLPRAGERFSIGVAMFVREGGKQSRIRSGSVNCSASIQGRRLPPVLVGVTPGKGIQCAWRVPASARGATLVVRITVRSAGVAATKTYRWRIA